MHTQVYSVRVTLNYKTNHCRPVDAYSHNRGQAELLETISTLSKVYKSAYERHLFGLASLKQILEMFLFSSSQLTPDQLINQLPAEQAIDRQGKEEKVDSQILLWDVHESQPSH